MFVVLFTAMFEKIKILFKKYDDRWGKFLADLDRAIRSHPVGHFFMEECFEVFVMVLLAVFIVWYRYY
jgi:hypothetical protein